MKTIAIAISLLLLTATDARVPLRDECARQVVEQFEFIRWRHPPVHRPMTLEEIGARTALQLCRWQQWRDGQRAEWAQEVGA